MIPKSLSRLTLTLFSSLGASTFSLHLLSTIRVDPSLAFSSFKISHPTNIGIILHVGNRFSYACMIKNILSTHHWLTMIWPIAKGFTERLHKTYFDLQNPTTSTIIGFGKINILKDTARRQHGETTIQRKEVKAWQTVQPVSELSPDL